MSRVDLIRSMKEEIQTLEQFDAVGSTAYVAMRYGVDHGDAHLYRKELEKRVVKREEENVMRHVTGESLAAGKLKADKMRAEITTIEQFLDIGTVANLAKKYDVAVSTAHAWHKKLTADAKAKRQKKTAAAPIETEAVTETTGTVPKTAESVPETAESVTKTAESVTTETLEQFFDTEPEPELPKASVMIEKPVQIRPTTAREELALELLNCVEIIVSNRHKFDQASRIKEHFESIREAHQNAIDTSASPADVFLHKRDLEIIKQIEAGLLAALVA